MNMELVEYGMFRDDGNLMVQENSLKMGINLLNSNPLYSPGKIQMVLIGLNAITVH